MHSMPSSALHLPLHWIGPTPGDITADCVAKAFGVPIDSDSRALAILHEWVKTIGAERGAPARHASTIEQGLSRPLTAKTGFP
jgi:molybdopterin-biosynthesis enzyme MoeA-like protein